VDDQPVINQNEIRILEDTLPVKVDTSLSTQDALDKLSNTRYDLVISGLGLPESRRAGLDLLSQCVEAAITTSLHHIAGW
jgi:DNA-binding NarL/FixJ family response regulator